MKNLKKRIICKHCNKVNIKKELDINEAAYCGYCGKLLYPNVKNLEYKIFVFSISLLIFFIIAMALPIISVDIIGYQEKFQVIKASFYLFKEGYIFISFFVLISVVIFPFICLITFFILSILFITKYNKNLAKKLLIFITIIKEWCFFDIFFIAILIAMIKMFSYASINLESGFYAFLIFLIISFLIKLYKVENLWEIWENM